jgi:CheY-like chemotaxis protein
VEKQTWNPHLIFTREMDSFDSTLEKNMFGKKDTQTNPIKEQIAQHLRAADYLVKDGKLDHALHEIEKALKLDPKNLFARSFYERVRFQIERAQKDAQQSAKSKELSDEQRLQQISLLLKAADQMIQAKNYKLALQQVAKVYQIDPRNYYAQAYSERIEQLMEHDKKSIPMPAAPQAAVQAPAPSAPASEQLFQKGERASLTMYRELLREMWFDGKITEQEDAELKKVREIFKISQEQHAELEKQVQIDAYIEALRIAWRDGAISQNESEVLQVMREKYNISMEEHMSAEAKILWAKNTPQTKAAVLLVDDEKTFLLSLAANLKKHGYDVVTAETVEQALGMLEQSAPSLILSDLLLGEGRLTGIEFYQRVRENRKLNNVPFLLMSGISDEFVVRAGVRMGVDDFIQKPFNLELLLATIEGKLKS